MISAKKKIPNDFIQLVTPFKLNDLILKIKSILKVEVIKSEEKSVNNYAIVIHGGAGTVIRENTPKELQEKYQKIKREYYTII